MSRTGNATEISIETMPIFYVTLADRDEWAVEVEWPDGTLERVGTFRNYHLAASWVKTQSETWAKVRRNA